MNANIDKDTQPLCKGVRVVTPIGTGTCILATATLVEVMLDSGMTYCTTKGNVRVIE